MKRFFGKSAISNFELKDNKLTTAKLQEEILNKKSCEEIYDKYTVLE